MCLIINYANYSAPTDNNESRRRANNHTRHERINCSRREPYLPEYLGCFSPISSTMKEKWAKWSIDDMQMRLHRGQRLFRSPILLMLSEIIIVLRKYTFKTQKSIKTTK